MSKMKTKKKSSGNKRIKEKCVKEISLDAATAAAAAAASASAKSSSSASLFQHFD